MKHSVIGRKKYWIWTIFCHLSGDVGVEYGIAQVISPWFVQKFVFVVPLFARFSHTLAFAIRADALVGADLKTCGTGVVFGCGRCVNIPIGVASPNLSP